MPELQVIIDYIDSCVFRIGFQYCRTGYCDSWVLVKLRESTCRTAVRRNARLVYVQFAGISETSEMFVLQLRPIGQYSTQGLLMPVAIEQYKRQNIRHHLDLVHLLVCRNSFEWSLSDGNIFE